MPQIEIIKHPDFRVVVANEFFGGLSPNDGRIQFYTDIIEAKIAVGGVPGSMKIEKINRELQVDIRLSVMDFVKLAAWMNKHVKRLQDQGILKKGKVPKFKPPDCSV